MSFTPVAQSYVDDFRDNAVSFAFGTGAKCCGFHQRQVSRKVDHLPPYLDPGMVSSNTDVQDFQFDLQRPCKLRSSNIQTERQTNLNFCNCTFCKLEIKEPQKELSDCIRSLCMSV